MLVQKKILIIEDERQLARLIELELRHESYDVKVEYDGEKGLSSAKLYEPDLILLDIMLPGMDGMEVCRRIREFSSVAVIMLTAKAETIDKVTGLDSGANDYMTKPFEVSELLARIRAAFRSSGNKEKSTSLLHTVNNLVIDLSKHLVKRGDTSIPLTKKEFELLEYLVQNRSLVLSREQILDHVWGMDYEGEANVVDVYIRYLRSKIDEPFQPKLIHTVRGYGYVLEDKKSDAWKE